MRADIVASAEAIKESVGLLRRHLDWDVAQKRLAELNALAESNDLWNDPDRAQKVMQERNALDGRMTALTTIERDLSDNLELAELAEAEDDAATLEEAAKALADTSAKAQRLQLEALLSGEADANDTYLEIHAGSGGTESQDWALMLMRMYTRWAERRGFKVEVVEESEGEEAGIKSTTLLIKGHNAYGWLKTEAGVHRLVRISPFDSNARRHTSFAAATVYPVIDDKIDIQINEADVRVDTMRSGGAGGQHVNKTESAVRLVHNPTGIMVVSQGSRSQHANRAVAWQMLRAKLYERELKIREEAAAADFSAKTDIGWGHQIRSYVLQPYQLVKDLRTGKTSGVPSEVLDGDLDGFMEATLAMRAYGTKAGDTDDVE
ncbi:peptide chain release factor 2 [Phreatobacter sp. AB_2022a]|uniref:peptide chain release factor 2 n=1 Tax=Phreatobacter sp. AB_2022a TaxID=3003134 RepID=UPI0022876A63|nr:peptide chain release factor 2 [Phreatobacter sp. AB_2022a]MCZ0733928.1 peptide chain release factor 2 [Phreatobacter sp. AB_2022a]